MWPYWMMFLLPALVALMMETRRSGTALVGEAATPVGAWVVVGIVLTLLSFVFHMARSPVRRSYRATDLLPRILFRGLLGFRLRLDLIHIRFDPI